LLAWPLNAAAQANDFEADVIKTPAKAEFAPRNTSRLSIAPAGLAYASFDSNSDYSVSLAELEAGIKSAFIFADKDKNGVLSLVEVDGWRIKALGSQDLLPGNTQFDRNFDARVTPREFHQVLTGTARSLDRDDDNKLSFDELLSAAPRQERVQRERSQQQRKSQNRPQRQR